MDNEIKVDKTKCLIFQPVTGKDFLIKAIIEGDGMCDLGELGFYFSVNDSFYLINECRVMPKMVEIRNTYEDIHIAVEMQEDNIIYQMVNINDVWR